MTPNPRAPIGVIPIRAAAADDDDELRVSLYQKQAKIYPRAVSGVFARWRVAMVLLTQAVFYGLPWLQWNGRQAVLFDLVEQRFFIFGLVLHPQDLIYLAALLVLSALALFFFTAVAGRLWCGYACPQTVYTEIFLWIERHTEGDRIARMQLDAAPWSVHKLVRKGGKQALWIALALVTGFTFVGYFSAIRPLLAQAATLQIGPWETFWILFYGAATYGNAGYLREQMCKYMCPYARFQSALIDRDSLVIAYDAGRGEARGSRSRKADPRALGLGDCIDCTLCVQVCPTGIDIRNGLQNECIGCAACIDVCDDVMAKMNYPKGLIRYATSQGMDKHWTCAQMLRRAIRPRVLIYGALLLGVSAAFVASVWQRGTVGVDVIRDRGTLARTVEDGQVENVYRLQLMNRSEQPLQVQIGAGGLPGLRVATAAAATIAPNAIDSLTVRLVLPAEQAAALKPGAHPITFTVTPPAGVPGAGRSVAEGSTFVVLR